jgi:hypothetical protein
LVLGGLVLGTWLLVAGFVRQLSASGASQTNGTSLAVWGAAALAAYLWTIGYGVYYRRHWSVAASVAPKVNRSPLAPLWRWFGVLGVVAVLSIVLGNGFETRMADFEVQLALQSLTLLCIGAGLVWVVAPNGTSAHSRGTHSPGARQATAHQATAHQAKLDPEPTETPPAFFTAARRVIGWTLVCMVGGALVFTPTYLVMKGFSHYVDVPACRTTCRERGYAFEDLKVGKRTYECTCIGPDTSRYVFQERATLTGGHGLFDYAVDWVVRASCVLGTLALTFLALAKSADVYRAKRAVSPHFPPTSGFTVSKTTSQIAAPNRKR